ncbi:MFS transporter [Saccharolobus islandicus]|uniref:Major facilitator superfamily MFS_1 n=1 Tax=Saccharolobus islandicus (strain L.D.8.5 / Lassen \|nr:MFS transporter [Sulfolobus islandicus]ADB87478.1 major facilitator superfamily MFS_1 [Sulfolobus islandicus L.D.8.5]PVU76435.1 MFS transporter [Sulfolobus islandicus]
MSVLRNCEYSFLSISFIISFSLQLMGAYLILWFYSIGLSFTEIGLITSIYMILTLPVDIPSSALADKYGRLKIFSIGTLIYSLGLISLSASSSPIFVFLSYGIMGIGLGIYSNTLEAWVVDSLNSREKLPKIFSRQQIANGIAGFLGNAVASVLILLYHKLNFPILIAGLVMILSVIIALLSEDNKGGKTTTLPAKRIVKEGVKHVASERALLALLTSSIFTVFPLVAWMQFVSPYVVNVLGLPQKYWGFILSAYFLTVALGGYINEKLLKKVNHRLITIFSVFLLSLFVLTLSISNLSLILFLLFGLSLIYPIRSSNIISWENELIPSNYRATVLSSLSFIIRIIYILVPPLVGYLINTYGYSLTYIIVGLISLIGVIPLVIAYEVKTF